VRLGYTLRASANMARHPIRGIERIRGRLDRRNDWRELAALERPVDDVYEVTDVWHERLHAALNIRWPCRELESFSRVWEAAVRDLSAAGLRTGLASYGGWNDGDPAQAEALWCIVAHMRPTTVVETGVAHGLSSRVILEGLRRNGTGQLWSVDLPAVDSALHHEIGIAVPEEVRSRWTYVPGTSRERLPSVVQRAGHVDLFVHDSLHTARNTCFELDTVWPALRPGGVAIVDDVDHSLGFRTFIDRSAPETWTAARHAVGNGIWAIAVKKSQPARAVATPRYAF
jgi:predicted O-methyltransferase YrrM